MFGTLFLKECKQMLKCLTYYVVVICMILMYSSQLGSEEIITKPIPGHKSYGFTYSNDKSVIMKDTMINLAREYWSNKYGAYPFGFYKSITLGKDKQSKMREILSDVTGLDKGKVDTYIKNYFESPNSVDSSKVKVSSTKSSGSDAADEKNINKYKLSVKQGLTYEQFVQCLAKADKLIGGGTDYVKDKLQQNAYVPRTYEQALQDYNDIIQKDHLTGAYARLFCDYMGIVLAILPIFIAVTRALRDKRARAEEIIFCRKASSFHIVISRYLSIVVMILLPVLILSTILGIECIGMGNELNVAGDYFAFPIYILGWLLPTILITTSLGLFLTELTDCAIAIVVQGLWWFISIFSGELLGSCGWNLIPRHNSTGYYDVFMKNMPQFVMNRAVYTVAAIIILIATVSIYDRKRKGRWNLRGQIFSNRKIKSKA